MRQEQQQPTQLTPFFGTTKEVELPSGKVVTIRETNGEDDELLSNLVNAQTGKSIYNFLASIITLDHDTSTIVTPEDIGNWKANDLYYLMVEQRIFNRGCELVFKMKCSNPNCPSHGDGYIPEYTENLEVLIFDKKPKYPLGNQPEAEIVTSSGEVFKFDILSAEKDRKSLEVPEDAQSRNLMLTVRNLRHKQGDGTFLPVKYFGYLSSRIVSEIRAAVKKLDPKFDPIVEVDCPRCKQHVDMPLLRIPDFFWPGEEI